MPYRLLGSSTFRLALMYVLLFSTSVLLLFAYIYWSTAAYMAGQTDDTIQAEIAGLAERYDIRGLRGLTSLIAERVDRQSPTGASLYLLTDPRFKPIVGNLNGWPSVDIDDSGWMNFRIGDYAMPRDNVHRARARPFLLRGGFHLLVGRDVQELADIQQLIVRALIWGTAITVLLALAGGILTSRSVSRRLETINETCHNIMSGDLSQRIATRATGDEFDDLADNVNNMLNRIESLMEGVSRVSDNIAHDLRTPLSRLKGRLESAKLDLDNHRDPGNVVEDALSETDQLLTTFNALLRIARIESAQRHAEFSDVPLDRVLEDVIELYQPLAEEKNQTLIAAIEPEIGIAGDRDLLFQAFANVLDNAVKYAPQDGLISVTSSRSDSGVEVAIADSGPGIPEAYRERVLQRFFRMEHSRTTLGNGLGLSLVDAVVNLHDAQLQLENNCPGLRVRFLFSPQTRPR
ncbi:MAG: ATP-binding protein [Gammaproteobacteria bacterium]|nr:ATP-binding protein [Gammaproteobacteria bacterium]